MPRNITQAPNQPSREMKEFGLGLILYLCAVALVDFTRRPDTVAFSAVPGLPFFPLWTTNGIIELGIVVCLSAILIGWLPRTIPLLMASGVLTYFSLSYFTTHGAFTHFVVISLLFFTLHKNASSRTASWAARSTLGLTFLFAALHKCNATFLSGAELKYGEMLIGVRYIFRPMVAALASYSWVPWFIILGEAAIGILCLIGSPLGGLSVLLFCLSVNLFQLPVSVVYLAFLPFVLLGFPEFARQARRILRKGTQIWISLPFAWMLSLSIYFYGKKSFEPTRVFAEVSALTFTLTLMLLTPSFVSRLFRRSWHSLAHGRSTRLREPHITPWLVAFTVYCSLPFVLPIPVPFSFTMFSGRNILRPAEGIAVRSSALCHSIQHHYMIRWAGLVAYGNPQQADAPACTVYIPSARIRRELFERLCSETELESNAVQDCKGLAQILPLKL
jgi:hypothetical protein